MSIIAFKDHAGRYRVVVKTGVRPNAGLSAETSVYIRLVGTFGRTTDIELVDNDDDESNDDHTFQRNSIASFLVSTPLDIGVITKIRIRHDGGSTGESLWYLYRIEVTNVHKAKDAVKEDGVSSGGKDPNAPQHFWIDRWLGINMEDGNLHTVANGLSSKAVNTVERSFSETVTNMVADEHTLMTVFLHPPGDPYTKVARTMTFMLYMFVTILANAFFYRTDKEKSNAVQVITTGLMTSFITVVPTLIVVQLFKFQPAPAAAVATGSRLSIPISKAVAATSAWLLCLGGISWASYYCLLLSIDWGKNVSMQWVGSIVASVIFMTVIINPFWIFLIAGCTAYLFKSVKELNVIAKHQRKRHKAVRRRSSTVLAAGTRRGSSGTNMRFSRTNVKVAEAPDPTPRVVDGAGAGKGDAGSIGATLSVTEAAIAKTILARRVKRPVVSSARREFVLRDAEMKSIFGRLLFFSIMFASLALVLFMPIYYGVNPFGFTKSVEAAVNAEGFTEVGFRHEFWSWAHDTVGSFRERRNSNEREQKLLNNPDLFILGPARIRQLRVVPDAHCSIPKVILPLYNATTATTSNTSAACYADWSPETNDQRLANQSFDFLSVDVNRGHAAEGEYKHRLQSTGSSSYVGWYPGSLYVASSFTFLI